MEKIAILLLWMVPFVFSLSVHEFAHAWTANRLGDPTARFLGRMTLNPVAHADPIGTILFPLIAFFTGFPLIGWAKPVPVNERNLKNWSRDGILVAAAGPISNLILAMAFTFLAFLLNRFQAPAGLAHRAEIMLYEPLLVMATVGIQLNLILAMFNLIPLPPLDGGRVAAGLLPGFRQQFMLLERYGFILLLVLFYTGIIRVVVFYPTQILYQFLLSFTV